MKNKKAVSKIQINNNLVKVTKFLFLPGQETGMHKHLYDYIVTPITAGKLLLIDKNGNENDYKLTASQSYFRRAGVEHNVINNGNTKIIFIETELKNRKKDKMNNTQKDEFNLQIRKILKEFGVKAHSLVEKRYENNISDCEISIKLTIDSKQIEEIKRIIKIS